MDTCVYSNIRRLYVAGECESHAIRVRRAAFVSFLEDADTMRLMVYLDGKDLVAVRR